jgi:hypothetical protein
MGATPKGIPAQEKRWWVVQKLKPTDPTYQNVGLYLKKNEKLVLHLQPLRTSFEGNGKTCGKSTAQESRASVSARGHDYELRNTPVKCVRSGNPIIKCKTISIKQNKIDPKTKYKTDGWSSTSPASIRNQIQPNVLISRKTSAFVILY